MLEKAFYRALMEDQVERIKDIILDDDEMDAALEKTANLIVKIMKKQWQEGISKSRLSEEIDSELEKIFRKKNYKKDEADVDEADEEDDMDEDEADEKRI